jgi:hypothetical protein
MPRWACEGTSVYFLLSLLSGNSALAKLRSKNQITLSDANVQVGGEADFYDVTVQDGKIVLTPVSSYQFDPIQTKLGEEGIT